MEICIFLTVSVKDAVIGEEGNRASFWKEILREKGSFPKNLVPFMQENGVSHANNKNEMMQRFHCLKKLKFFGEVAPQPRITRSENFFNLVTFEKN